MNRLAHESSPYLLQHAHNPVDWFPWGDEAIAKARRENKPIFLSIGYSTCHWCHVMERESFENAAIADLLNAHFVPIKVDREERPDLDHIYMTAVQAMTGSGGWPMSVWLTPELKPFYCGTYFPPWQFATLLERIHAIWSDSPDRVVEQADAVFTAIAPSVRCSREPARGLPEETHPHIGREQACGYKTLPDDDAPLRIGLARFREAFDPQHGGFGGAPKFPRPVVFNFLFRAGGADMALFTLRKMAEGGLFDHLGGGFHRYSVDDRWLVPHFEKMLYDQAQLVVTYIEAYQITGDEFFADIARRTCDYVLGDLTSPDGGFYSAEDADSEGVEGKFYVWTHAEIEAVLGDRADAFGRSYGVKRVGNWEYGLNILHGTGFPEERAALLAVRNQRVRPHRDEKIITAWNGLMISALAKAARVLDQPQYLAAAQRVAGRYGKIVRSGHAPAVLDDYAFLATGLVDLYETDFDPRWLTKAEELTDTILRDFADPDGGFFMTTGADASVIVRPKEEYDGAEPSGNSMAALLLLRLAELTGRVEYGDAAWRTLVGSTLLRSAPQAVPQMLCALDWALGEPKLVTLTGPPERFLPVLRKQFLPMVSVRHWPGADATAQVCVRGACQLPVSDPEELKTALEPISGAG